MKLKSILFDLDGTLCDCTEVHYVSLNKALEQISGIEISREDHENLFNGKTTNTKLNMLAAAGKIEEKDKVYIWELKQKYTKESVLDLLKVDNVKIKLLQYLKSKNIKIACVTNSIITSAELMLQCTGQLEYMDLVIGNEMVKNPKPHAEGYIRAMIMLNSLPEETLVVEDSPVGLQSAKASGANIWKVDGFNDVSLEEYLKLGYQ